MCLKEATKSIMMILVGSFAWMLNVLLHATHYRTRSARSTTKSTLSPRSSTPRSTCGTMSSLQSLLWRHTARPQLIFMRQHPYSSCVVLKTIITPWPLLVSLNILWLAALTSLTSFVKSMIHGFRLDFELDLDYDTDQKRVSFNLRVRLRVGC